MIRLFPENKKRTRVELEGEWQFTPDITGQGISEQWYRNIPSQCRAVFVPSLWTCDIQTLDYIGVGWYFREIETTGCSLYLHFEAVTGQADVWLDGRHQCAHYGGFTGFGFHAHALPAGRHLLAVRVDSTPDDLTTIPLAHVDWYHHGGIPRAVWMCEYTGAFIEALHIGYRLQANQAVVSAEICLHWQGEAPEDELLLFCNGTEVARAQIGANQQIKLFFTLEDIQRWSPDNPTLYRFDAELSGDATAEMTGFRTIEAQSGMLLLNGEKLCIRGVNRHEEHPDFGYALPFTIMSRDIALIRQLGCNAIRLSHYPNSRLFLDLCDSEGILLWEEIPMWGFPEQALLQPLVLERGLAMHREMVLRDLNHPAIILWGMHNEVDTRTQAAFDLTQAFTRLVRSLDSSRPLTMATHHPLEDICLSLVDVIGVNKYHGWYDGGLAKWPGFLEAFFDKLSQEGFGNKPVIMSEFGAGGIPGVHSLEEAKWSEEYQATYLDYTLGLFAKDQRLSGTYIWQYCDIRVCKNKELERPRSFNNKGIFDEYRRPKMARNTVIKRYHE